MGKKLPILTLVPDSYEAVVASYIREQRRGALAERESFARELTFESAVPRWALPPRARSTPISGKCRGRRAWPGPSTSWPTSNCSARTIPSSGYSTKPELRRSMELWVGCVAGALTQDDYKKLLGQAGFEQIGI